ncbi:MAG: hypothetical protein LBC81_00955 [Tannerellaceae bacterium]|nr:hypothetical protein [Tannerellaceae bacterium]
MDDPAILSKPTMEAALQVKVQQEPLITLYDLFGFSEEERSQVKRPRRRKKTPPAKKEHRSCLLWIGGRRCNITPVLNGKKKSDSREDNSRTKLRLFIPLRMPAERNNRKHFDTNRNGCSGKNT